MVQTDKVWLGNAAELGPFVRAGLGLLLAQGDWTWWHHPGAASTVLLNTVKTQGFAVWGGDSAVLTAHEWLDANIAVEVAAAFRRLVARRGAELRLTIQRQVFKWGDGDGIEVILDDLQKAFNRQQIFIEWPADRRPRRRITQLGNVPLTVISSALTERNAEGLMASLPEWQLAPSAVAATIAIGPLDYILSLRSALDLVIVVGDNKREVLSQLDAIRTTTGAQAALFLPSDPLHADNWFRVLGDSIRGGESMPNALENANTQVSGKAEFLAVTQQFMLHSRKFIAPRRLDIAKVKPAEVVAESTSLSPPPRREPQSSQRLPYPNLEIEGVKMKALPPVTRILRAVAKQDQTILDRFPAHGSINVSVFVAPLSPLESTVSHFPEHQLNWDGKEVELQVHMTRLGFPTHTAFIMLPRSGTSGLADFELEIVPEQTIDVRFLVAEGARILQTSRLQGAPSGKIEFFVESMNTSLEQRKNAFDLALLVNDSLGDQPSATVLTKDGIRLELLEEHDIAMARDQLRFILESCVHNPNASLGPMLFDLANHGKQIFDTLKQHTEGWPERIDRVQLTTPGDKFFPLEFLYDGQIPDNSSGGLCADRKTCLTSGSAKENCAIRAARQQLCPMGFLGISATIERQTWDRSMDKAACLRQAKDSDSRTRITNLTRTMFAAADRADHFTDDDVQAGFDVVRIKDIELHTGERQPNWEQWKLKVLSVQPNLIVLLPHIDNSHVHIGADERLAFGAVNEVHLGTAEPIVIAMGCNSAVGFTGKTGLPAVLMRRGARIVVAALTGILGRYANIATRDLTAMLVAAASAEAPTSVGTMLNGLRRRFLAKDNPLGLVLIAYGDADYILGGMDTQNGANV